MKKSQGKVQKQKPASSQKKAYKKFINKDKGRNSSRYYYPTNNIMIDPQQKKIYLPGFLRLKVKSFTQMDIGALSAALYGEIVFTIYYGELFQVFGDKKQQKIENCLMNQVRLLFQRDDAIKLTNNKEQMQKLEINMKANHDLAKHEVKFIVTKIFNLDLDSDVFYTPFQLIHAILEVSVKPVDLYNYPCPFKQPANNQNQQKMSLKLEEPQTENYKIYFNLQNSSEINEKIQCENWGTFGNYDLAQKKIGALYTNYRISGAIDFAKKTSERIDQQKNQRFLNDFFDSYEMVGTKLQIKDQFLDPDHATMNIFKTTHTILSEMNKIPAEIQPFHHAYFNIPLYKFPLSPIFTIFLPLFFLDILNFGILFQDKELADRMGTIATLVLAFAALIPIIRSQIPPTPKITLVEILVYIQTAPTLLSIIQSLFVAVVPQEHFQFDWLHSGYFWTALIISVSTFLIVLTLTALHYCKWFAQYNDVVNKANKPVFDRTKWRNTECNLYFHSHFSQQAQPRDNPQVVILESKTTEQYKISFQNRIKIQEILLQTQNSATAKLLYKLRNQSRRQEIFNQDKNTNDLTHVIMKKQFQNND